MILCSPTPVSIIKAALMIQIYQDIPCFHHEQTKSGLFMDTPVLDADEQTTASLIKQLATNCSLDASWLLHAPGQCLGRLVAANLRYQSPNQLVVIFAAIEEALRFGHAYCLCGVGNSSRLLINHSRAVAKEIHRMLGFIRFQPGPDASLIACPKLFHNTADLILRRFAPRYPHIRLIFILGDTALILENGQFSRLPAQEFLPYIEKDDFQQAWDTYYQSQYITTRKNSKLASRVIPKKYWDWLAEGKVLAYEDQCDKDKTDGK